MSRLASLTDPRGGGDGLLRLQRGRFVECTIPVFALRSWASALDGRRPSLFLPPYVRLPQDAVGGLVLPRFTVTSVVERRLVWARRIPNMDAVLPDGRVIPTFKPIHKSWEHSKVKEMLGRKLAVWLYQGALEWIHPLLPRPIIIIEPKGAVPKKGPDKFRDILDSREGNKSLTDWDVRYHTARGRADALRHCVGARH